MANHRKNFGITALDKLTVPPNGYLDNEALEQMGGAWCGRAGDKIQIAAIMYLVNVTK